MKMWFIFFFNGNSFWMLLIIGPWAHMFGQGENQGKLFEKAQIYIHKVYLGEKTA